MDKPVFDKQRDTQDTQMDRHTDTGKASTQRPEVGEKASKVQDEVNQELNYFSEWVTRAVSDCLIRPLPASVNALLVNCA